MTLSRRTLIAGTTAAAAGALAGTALLEWAGLDCAASSRGLTAWAQRNVRPPSIQTPVAAFVHPTR
jgi:hypothetical protein